MNVVWWRAGVYFQGVGVHAVVCLLVAALFVVGLVNLPEAPGASEVVMLMESLAPLPVVVVAAGLLQADPALELLASYRLPLGSLLLSRWLVAVLLGLLPPLGLYLALAWLEPGSHLSPLVWFAPMLFLSALAIAASAAFANALAGLGTALVYWAASILTVPALHDSCSQQEGAWCSAALWSTSYGLISSEGPGWVANRMLLLILAGALAFLAVRLYSSPERQLAGRSRTEEYR